MLRGWKFTSVGHAPDLSKPVCFDFMRIYLHGAWRNPFHLYSCKWPLIPGLKIGGFSAFITKYGKEVVACNITRMGQMDEIQQGEMFCCFAYEPIDPAMDKEELFRKMEENGS